MSCSTAPAREPECGARLPWSEAAARALVALSGVDALRQAFVLQRQSHGVLLGVEQLVKAIQFPKHLHGSLGLAISQARTRLAPGTSCPSSQQSVRPPRSSS